MTVHHVVKVVSIAVVVIAQLAKAAMIVHHVAKVVSTVAVVIVQLAKVVSIVAAVIVQLVVRAAMIVHHVVRAVSIAVVVIAQLAKAAATVHHVAKVAVSQIGAHDANLLVVQIVRTIAFIQPPSLARPRRLNEQKPSGDRMLKLHLQ